MHDTREIGQMLRAIIRQEIAAALDLPGQADQGALRGPKPTPTIARPDGSPLAASLSAVEEAILEAVAGGLETPLEVSEALSEYTPGYVANTMARMVARGLLARPCRGVYALARGVA